MLYFILPTTLHIFHHIQKTPSDAPTIHGGYFIDYL